MRWQALVSVVGLLGLVGCDGCSPEAAEHPSGELPTYSMADYFPTGLGDRWRFGDGTLSAVTARQENTAVFFGTDRTSAARYRALGQTVTSLAPDGSEIGSFLEGPPQSGRRWLYTLGDAECEAEIKGTGEDFEVAGLTLHECISVERSCHHPAGKPFAEATTERHQERYCPQVGLVAEELSLDPVPQFDGTPMQTPRRRLETYRVAGSPSPQPLGGEGEVHCGDMLLMPTDVAAACGPAFRSEAPEGTLENNVCSYVFTAPAGTVTVQLSMPDHQGEGNASAVVETPERLVRVLAEEEVCAAANLRRLEPTMRSLLRR